MKPAFLPALDAHRVRAALESRLLPERRIRGVAVQDARYRPHGTTWFLYRLEMDEPAVPVHVAARLLSQNDPPAPPSPELVDRYRAWPDAAFQEAWFVDRSLSVEFYAFPVDPGLPYLFEAADATRMKRRFDPFAPQARVRDVASRNRSYLPHSRATFAYDVYVENGTDTTLRFVGKMQSGKSARERFARHEALWSAVEGRLSIPRPLGAIDEAGIALQEHVTGERLGARVDRPGFEALAREAARNLALFHGLRIPGLRERAPLFEAKNVTRWADLLRALRPDLLPRIDALETQLIRMILGTRPAPALIHADFHHTNVLVDGDRLTFIDLDELAMGDPMVDVGRFMASLRIPGLRAFGHASALDDAGNAFLDAYLRLTGGPERRARLYEAASLLIAAGSSFRLQREHWPEEIEWLLEIAERITTDVRRPFVNRIGLAPTGNKDVQVPRAVRDLNRALAERARGKSMIVGPEDEFLVSALRARGCPVIAIPGLDALEQTPETATTIIVRELLEHLDEAAGNYMLRMAWERVRAGGRLIVVVPNGSRKDGPEMRRFSRRSLRHQLRVLGHPELATDQPYRWLVMIVRKPGGGPPALSRTNRQRARITVKLCQGNVIDLGCGEGHLAGLLAEDGHQVTGIDKNKKKIEIARMLYPEVTFLSGDLRTANLDPGSFDTALLTEVLEHLSPDAAKEAVETAMHFLKPGGRLVVSVPNEDCVPHRNHLQEFDRRSLRLFLEPYGKTRLVTEQPYKWLLMTVEKP